MVECCHAAAIVSQKHCIKQRSEVTGLGAAGKVVALGVGLCLLGGLVLRLNPLAHGHSMTSLLTRDVGGHWHP